MVKWRSFGLSTIKSTMCDTAEIKHPVPNQTHINYRQYDDEWFRVSLFFAGFRHQPQYGFVTFKNILSKYLAGNIDTKVEVVLCRDVGGNELTCRVKSILNGCVRLMALNGPCPHLFSLRNILALRRLPGLLSQ